MSLDCYSNSPVFRLRGRWCSLMQGTQLKLRSGGVIPLLRFWNLLLWRTHMLKSYSFSVFFALHHRLVLILDQPPRYRFWTTPLPFLNFFFSSFYKHIELYDLLVISEYAFQPWISVPFWHKYLDDLVAVLGESSKCWEPTCRKVEQAWRTKRAWLLNSERPDLNLALPLAISVALGHILDLCYL